MAVARALMALAVLLGLAGMAAAQVAAGPPEPPRSSILTLDEDRLFKGTLFGQSVASHIAIEIKALTAENQKIDSDLEAEERALTVKRATLPAEEFRVLADAFDSKVQQMRADQDAKSKALTALSEKERKRFFETAVPILGEMMRDIGAVAILRSDAVILSFDRIDITDEAIARIDSVLGDGSDLAPAPADPAPSP